MLLGIMSRQAITRDLFSLMPGWTSSLPAELVDLTNSLLAQSRSKAANLKKDEEIARGYVCANIACERLKRNLDLPDITPRPPVHQRTYKKVYQYLNSTLSAAQSSRHQSDSASTPSKPGKVRKNGSATPQTIRTARQTISTPSKTVLPHRSPSKKATPRSVRHNQAIRLNKQVAYITSTTSDLEFPSWIMQSIRAICTAWSRPSAAPHIFAGVSSVARHLASSKSSVSNTTTTPIKSRRTTSSNRSDDHDTFLLQLIPSLAFTIAIYTDTQFGRAPEAEGEYAEKRTEVYTIFARSMPRAQSLDAKNNSTAGNQEADESAQSHGGGSSSSNSDDHHDESDQLAPHAIVKDITKYGLLLPKHVYEKLCEQYNALADEEWLNMEWYSNVCQAAEAYKDDRQADVMDIDSDSTSSHNGARGADAESAAAAAATPYRSLKRSRTSRSLQDRKRIIDDEAAAHEHDDPLRYEDAMSRQGGEMMLARIGWMDTESTRAYDKWAARTRRRIALRRQELHKS